MQSLYPYTTDANTMYREGNVIYKFKRPRLTASSLRPTTHHTEETGPTHQDGSPAPGPSTEKRPRLDRHSETGNYTDTWS